VIFAEHFAPSTRVILQQTVAKWWCIKLWVSGFSEPLCRPDAVFCPPLLYMDH